MQGGGVYEYIAFVFIFLSERKTEISSVKTDKLNHMDILYRFGNIVLLN